MIDPIRLIAAILTGWLLALVLAEVSQRFLDADGLPRPTTWPGAPDPVAQAGTAIVALLLALVDRPPLATLSAIVLASFLVQVAVTDLRVRYVYLLVVGVGLVAAILLGPIVHSAPPWSSAAGALAGIVGVGLLYLIGRRLYSSQEPLARGDIWIAGLVGAAGGPSAASALLFGIVFSGLLALGILVVRRSGKEYFSYGPGLCLGGIVGLFLGA